MCFKNIYDGFIISISTGLGQTPITQEEYDNLMSIIRSAPSAPDGYAYMLRADTMEWKLVELPPDPEPGDEDAGEEDYLQVLDDLGVRL